MAHAKTEIPSMKTSRTDLTAPVIMMGKAGVDYVLHKCKAQTTNHVAIGDLVVWSTFPTTVEYCADNGLVIGIVPNTAFNLRALAVNNPTTQPLTKELFFDATETIEVALPIHNILVSAKVEASSAITAGECLMAGATGAIVANDDSSVGCGVAMAANTSGTGTDCIAMVLCPGNTLSTKT